MKIFEINLRVEKILRGDKNETGAGEKIYPFDKRQRQKSCRKNCRSVEENFWTQSRGIQDFGEQMKNFAESKLSVEKLTKLLEERTFQIE